MSYIEAKTKYAKFGIDTDAAMKRLKTNDIDQVIALVPGQIKMNLHASYAIFDEENGGWVDRDKLEPKHFKKWVEYCKERGLGCDFNPTFFSHPMCDALTLSSPNEELTRLQNEGNFTKLMVIQEELKTMPFGEVWDEYCKECGKPCDGEWLDIVERYEADVLSKRV